MTAGLEHEKILEEEVLKLLAAKRDPDHWSAKALKTLEKMRADGMNPYCVLFPDWHLEFFDATEMMGT